MQADSNAIAVSVALLNFIVCTLCCCRIIIKKMLRYIREDEERRHNITNRNYNINVNIEIDYSARVNHNNSLLVNNDNLSTVASTTFSIEEMYSFISRCPTPIGEIPEKCLICLEKNCNSMLIPCKHCILCECCLVQYVNMNRYNNIRNCPICRSYIIRYILI